MHSETINSKTVRDTQRHRRGFTIIELLVGLAILGIISMGLATLLADSAKNQRRIENKTEAQSLADEAKSIIKSSANCGITALPMNVKNWNKATTYNIILEDTFGSLKIESKKKYSSLSINSVYIAGYLNNISNAKSFIGLESGLASNDRYIRASIEVTVSENANTTLRPINIPVKLTLDPSKKKIIACSHILEDALYSEMCGTLGGDWDADSSKCELPCPSGSTKDVDTSKCVFADNRASEDSDGNAVKFCSPTNNCGVMSRFLGTNYL